ncbi:MAG: cellulose synthase, partial [Burkholderiaceae bacterium]|nr:cellulose synthase [Burkholderiaceae bacterium]
MNTYFSIHYARRSRVLFSAALLSVLGLLTLPSEVVANNALAVKTLVEQARFWEGKGRSDLAVAAWKRLLQVDPGNTDALAAMAQFEADNNRPEAAKAYIDQLKAKPAVTQEAVRRIEGAIAMKSVNTDVLEQARAAAKAGRNDDAVGLYRQALEGRTLSGPLALEYYQTLGGSTNGWEDAR